MLFPPSSADKKGCGRFSVVDELQIRVDKVGACGKNVTAAGGAEVKPYMVEMKVLC